MRVKCLGQYHNAILQTTQLSVSPNILEYNANTYEQMGRQGSLMVSVLVSVSGGLV